ncbi:ADP-ribosylation factor-like protein 13B isoform X2 [Topomyia yanbarensis]|uniref:ADP-ribosylation factor-like protein 13B isoform X2 n=1 Tax=Topomyia yanbarensis TaxID=2498891 RepID=UPI00273C3880|nr:ADP-ribosylation factor-like protein 13B isoform X2 [Topomyia yanbarensis]
MPDNYQSNLSVSFKMGNFLRRCLSRVQPDDNTLQLLIVGLENVGKTEIAHKICGTDRTEFLQTKGCRVFNSSIEGAHVRLTEVGGAPEFRDIWKYYFLDVYGILFIVDASNINNIGQSYKVFKSLMSHDWLVGKPFLIIANKQDLPGSVDCIDLCEYFDIELLANKYQNPCMIEACGNWKDSDNEYDGLQFGISWLVNTIIDNKKYLMNRINFHRLSLEHKTNLFACQRPCTGISHKNSGIGFRETRPKTAPSDHPTCGAKNDENYLLKRMGLVSVRSGEVRTINMILSEASNGSAALTAVKEAVEWNDVTSNINNTETFVIKTNQSYEELTVEDLSLTITNVNNNKTLNGIT